MIFLGIVIIVSMVFYLVCMIPNYFRMYKARKGLKKLGIDPDFLLLRYNPIGDFHTNLLTLETILKQRGE